MAKSRMGKSMMGHKSWGSSASLGASKGSGPVMGAGELMSPGAGPGRAAQRKMGAGMNMNPTNMAPPGSPSGPMDMYSEGAKPGRGYKYPTTR